MSNELDKRPLFEASRELENCIDEIIKKYPHKKSAIMPALYLVQQSYGWIPDEAYIWIGDKVGVSAAHAKGVATFYTMYYKQAVGKYHIQICRTLSCMLCGAKEITEFVKSRLGVAAAEVTEDGLWSWEEVECLGSCGTAPMVQINDVFFENLSTESMGALMDRIEKELPEIRYSTMVDALGTGLSDFSRSQVWK